MKICRRCHSKPHSSSCCQLPTPGNSQHRTHRQLKLPLPAWLVLLLQSPLPRAPTRCRQNQICLMGFGTSRVFAKNRAGVRHQTSFGFNCRQNTRRPSIVACAPPHLRNFLPEQTCYFWVRFLFCTSTDTSTFTLLLRFSSSFVNRCTSESPKAKTLERIPGSMLQLCDSPTGIPCL